MPVRLRPRVAAILLLSLLAGCDEAPPPVASPPPEVSYVTLEAQPVSLTRALPGRVRAYVIAEVRPQVSGIIEERLFEEGSLVEEGQPLYQLDDATYQAELNSARASLARAEASAEIARLQAERAETLIGTKAISEQEYDNLVATARQAEAGVGVAEALVESTAVQLAYARITSPIDGRIGKSTVTKGALVTANQAEPLTTVQQLDPVYVDLTQSANELLALRRELEDTSLRLGENIPVTILFDDGTRYRHEGTLTFTDVAVDPTTGSFSLRAVVPNPSQLLMPGMYVRAVLSPAVIENGLLVPQEGIARDPKGNAHALVLTADNTVEQRDVSVAQAVGDDWLVRSGLRAGDRVIVEGLQKVQPGMTVQAVEVALRDEDTDPDGSPVVDDKATAGADAPPASGGL